MKCSLKRCQMSQVIWCDSGISSDILGTNTVCVMCILPREYWISFSSNFVSSKYTVHGVQCTALAKEHGFVCSTV